MFLYTGSSSTCSSRNWWILSMLCSRPPMACTDPAPIPLSIPATSSTLSSVGKFSPGWYVTVRIALHVNTHCIIRCWTTSMYYIQAVCLILWLSRLPDWSAFYSCCVQVPTGPGVYSGWSKGWGPHVVQVRRSHCIHAPMYSAVLEDSAFPLYWYYVTALALTCVNIGRWLTFGMT